MYKVDIISFLIIKFLILPSIINRNNDIGMPLEHFYHDLHMKNILAFCTLVLATLEFLLNNFKFMLVIILLPDDNYTLSLGIKILLTLGRL